MGKKGKDSCADIGEDYVEEVVGIYSRGYIYHGDTKKSRESVKWYYSPL